MSNSSIIIFSDGGSRGNPGHAASAYVIYKEGKVVKQDAKYLGIATNNVAEYMGVILAIEWLVKTQKLQELKTPIIFKLDSELVVKQLTGIYKIRDKMLLSLVLRIKDIIKTNNLNINFQHVPRSENAFADKLVNEKLDESSRL